MTSQTHEINVLDVALKIKSGARGETLVSQIELRALAEFVLANQSPNEEDPTNEPSE